MRTVTFLITLSLLLAGCGLKPEPQSQPGYQSNLPLVEKPASPQDGEPPVSEPAEPPWRLIPQQLDASQPGIDFSMQVKTAIIVGSTAVEHAAFNQAVQGQLEEWLKGYAAGLPATPAPDLAWWVTIDYQVTSAADWTLAMPFAVSSRMETQRTPQEALFSAGHELLSILFENHYFMGGAHPGTSYSALVYDASSGRLVTLAELFRPEADYLGLIASLCIADLSAHPGLTFDNFAVEGAAPRAENYLVWAVTPGGLLVVFQEYQVAPYAAGAQAVLLPYESLAAQLDPAGPLGSLAK